MTQAHYIVKMANRTAVRRFTAVFVMAPSVEDAVVRALANSPAYDVAQARAV